MGKDTSIEWTDGTWPIVQGCSYESPGCANCYAVPLLWRLAHNPNQKVSEQLQGLVMKNAAGKLHFTGNVALREDRLRETMGWKKPQTIFVPSHGDLFHPAVPFAFIDRVYAVMSVTPRHRYQVLTKRPARMREYITDMSRERSDNRGNAVHEFGYRDPLELLRWPPPNVCHGTSVEDTKRAVERVWELLQTPTNGARFLSLEPLLEDIDLTALCNGWWFLDALRGIRRTDGPDALRMGTEECAKIDQLLIGGESGWHPRNTDVRAIRSLVRQGLAAGTAVLVKQLGKHPVNPDDYAEAVHLLGMRDAKGGDMEEWPFDLRVRQIHPLFGVP